MGRRATSHLSMRQEAPPVHSRHGVYIATLCSSMHTMPPLSDCGRAAGRDRAREG